MGGGRVSLSFFLRSRVWVFRSQECPKHRVVVERELLGRIGTEVLGCNAQGIDVVYERVEQPIGNGIVGFALFDDSPVFNPKSSMA